MDKLTKRNGAKITLKIVDKDNVEIVNPFIFAILDSIYYEKVYSYEGIKAQVYSNYEDNIPEEKFVDNLSVMINLNYLNPVEDYYKMTITGLDIAKKCTQFMQGLKVL